MTRCYFRRQTRTVANSFDGSGFMDSLTINQEMIDQQRAQLATHRQRLALRLQQRAIHGDAWVPPEILFDIAEARKQIQRLKQVLGSWGIEVEDLPDDTSGSEAAIDVFESLMGGPVALTRYLQG